MSIEATPSQPERQSVSSVLHNNFREYKVGIIVTGTAFAEIAAAHAIHDYILYPQQVARQQEIDTRIGALESSNAGLEAQLDTLQADKAVFSRYDQSAPPQLQTAIDRAQSTVEANETTMTTLQQEYPATPISTNEIFGVLGGTTILACGAVLAMQRRKFKRQARAKEAFQDE